MLRYSVLEATTMTSLTLKTLVSSMGLLVLVGVSGACSAGGGDVSPRPSGVASGGATGGGPSPSGGSGITVVPGGGSGTQPEDCDASLEVTYRDFSEAHPDFEMAFRGDVVRRGLVAATLGPDSKPIFAGSIGCPPLLNSPTACDTSWSVTQPVITSATTFDQWYRTVAGVNMEYPGKIELTETPPGSGQYVFESSAFFPLGETEGFGMTPTGNHMRKNYLFTTEAHVKFGYQAGQRFTFRGDDDMWIFVNGKLAMDLGGMHGPEERVIDFDAQAAALGISPGGSYRMDVFHAERHTDGSNFKFTTNIACFTPEVVR